MFTAHPLKAFQGDAYILCFRALSAEAQLAYALTAAAFPGAVNHHLDASFHARGLHVQQQSGLVALDTIKVEILIAHDRAVGIVHHRITVPFDVVRIALGNPVVPLVYCILIAS